MGAGLLGAADEARGLSLRFPRFIREHPDKQADGATSVDQLVTIYRAQTRRVGASADGEGGAGHAAGGANGAASASGEEDGEGGDEEEL